MHPMIHSLCFLQAFHAHMDRLQTLSGAHWPRLSARVQMLLEALMRAESDEQVRLLVDAITDAGLESPARDLVRALLQQIQTTSDRLDHGTRSISMTDPTSGRTREVTVGHTDKALFEATDQAVNRAEVIAAGQALSEGLKRLEFVSPPVPDEPPPRYADCTFYEEQSPGERSRPLHQDQALRVDHWYQLEVAVRMHPVGAPTQGERRAFREPRQTRDVTIMVTAATQAEDFEIEEPVQTLVLPPQGDSTTNAYFRVRPKREAYTTTHLLTLQIRLYYLLNLLEVVSIKAEAVGAFETFGHSRLGLACPILCIQDRVESEANDFDLMEPRAMHIDITQRDRYYQLTFTFVREGVGEIALVAPVRLPTADLEHILTGVRKLLLGIVVSDTFAKQIEGEEGEFVQHMRELADWGQRLWNLVFRLRSDTAIYYVGEWLREHPLPDRAFIQVSVAPDAADFVLPWNLLYDRELPSEDQAPSPEGFWGLRYAIEQRIPSIRVGGDQRITVSSGLEVGFLAWPFKELSEQQTFMSDLLQRGQGQLATGMPIQQAEIAYRYLADCTSHIVYFFSHGHTQFPNVNRYGFSESNFVQLYDRLAPDSPLRSDWEELYQAIKAHQYESDTSWIGLRYGKLYLHKLYGGTVKLRNHPIVILNMCESAQITPSLSQSFIAFFMDRGARGVIGTECSMRPLFAHHFSCEFFEALLGGDQVGAILLDLRRRFIKRRNPLGLAYTLFGPATTRFDPPLLPKMDRAGLLGPSQA